MLLFINVNAQIVIVIVIVPGVPKTISTTPLDALVQDPLGKLSVNLGGRSFGTE